MSILAALPIIGNFFSGLFGIIDKNITDKDKAAELKNQIENVMQTSDLQKFVSEIESQQKIIIAEAQGQSWMQRNWRPLIMLLFGVIIANNYILNPWLSALFSINVVMQIPPDMWALLKLGLGGYVVGRTAEKIVTEYKKK